MPADTYDSVLGVLLQGTGNNNNAWGDNANNSVFKLLARATAGTATHTDTGGTLDLSTVVPPAGARLDLDYIHDFTGTLTSDLTVIVPAISKTWLFRNRTSGAFYLYVKTSGGTAVQVPQGTSKELFCDGTNVKRGDEEEIGDFVHSGATSRPGTLQCNGASLLRTAFPDLFAKIGTTWGAVDGIHFTLPLLTDTNRFLRSSGGALSVGTYQANVNKTHTHSISGIPGLGTLTINNAGGHTPAGSVFVSVNNDASGPVKRMVSNITTGPLGYGGTAFGGNVSNSDMVFSASFSGTAVPDHSHGISGALTAGSLATVADGSTEARPESAVCFVGIKY